MNRVLQGEKRYAYAPNSHNFIHILVHEVIDNERLELAIKKLHQANPILNSLLVRNNEGLERDELPFMMPEIIYLDRLNDTYYKKVMKEEERIPINLHNIGAYRLIILKDDEYTDIILMTHQLFMDANSSLHLMKALSLSLIYDFTNTSGYAICISPVLQNCCFLHCQMCN